MKIIHSNIISSLKSASIIIIGVSLFIVLLSVLSTSQAIAKKDVSARDTIATLVIEDARLVASDELLFKLRLLRHSEAWDTYANGTYQIIFGDPSIKMDSDSLSIFFTGVSDLKQYVSTGNQMPIDGYLIESTISENNRISVMVAGPEKYEDARFVPLNDSGIVIGEFRLKGKNGYYMPDKLMWQQPYRLFQACAYKLSTDSLFAPGVVWQYKDSNIELFDSLNSSVEFRNSDNSGSNRFILDYFKLEYNGQRVVNIYWKTSSEPFNHGFVLKRGMRLNPNQLPDEVDYTDIIASYLPDEDLKGTGLAGIGNSYFWQDTVPYRGLDFCYQLEYKLRKRDASEDIILANACLPVPNSVIYAANAAPNPFSDRTEIRFWLEDDVNLTAFVRDVRGKDVERLCTDKFYKYNMKQDPHIIVFSASEFAANGLYEIVLLATPIKDNSVTQSTALIKVQLLR